MKKKLLIMLLVLALVFSSAVTVLAACKDGGKEEYTITFRNTSRFLFELKTKNQQISKADVQAKEKEYSKQLSSKEVDGYFFSGWYLTVSEDEEGHNVYSDAINYARKYEADVDYEAGFEYLPLSGEKDGYTLIGVINGEKDWGPTNIHEDWLLEQDATEGWMYSITLDLQPGDQIKVKTAGVDWDAGKINIGYDRLNEVTLAEGATVELKDHELKGDLISVTDGNVFVTYWFESINATIVLNYRTSKFDIVINSAVIRDELPIFSYILVGSFGEEFGGEWNEKNRNEAVIFTEDEEAGTISITFTFKADQKWLITYNDGSWSFKADISSYSPSRVTKDESIKDAIPADLFTGDGDIIATYDCKVTLTLTLKTKELSVHVLEITIPDEDTVYWEDEGYTMVGNFADADWAKPRPDGDKYLFTQSKENPNIGTWSGELKAKTQFKVATNISAWTGRINIGWSDGLTAYDQNDKPIANLLEKVGDNIRIRTDCNVTITLDVRAKSIKIVVIEDVEVPPVTDDPDTRDWGICGSLTGWSSDIMLESQADGHKTISGQELAAGAQFKIRAEGKWDDSVGWHNENVKFVAGSGVDSIEGIFEEGDNGGGLSNIKVLKACTVDIDLYYVNDGTWTLIITVTAIG